MPKYLVPCGIPVDITIEADNPDDALLKSDVSFRIVAGLIEGGVAIWKAAGVWPKNIEYLPDLVMGEEDKVLLEKAVREIK